MIRCGMYLRLSREDGGEESNSIQNQRLLIQQFIRQKPDMFLTGEWVDDGWSGSRFDRPGFQKMMHAAYDGQIDCILVKDLSRLGREYIQTGYYLQEIFPKLGIRLIAISDQYDSIQSEFMEQSLLMPVLNLMNDAYCRDISQKVRWQQQTKRQMGEYIGAFAGYGYQKAEDNVHRLVIDEQVAEIVKGIYWLRLGGMAAERIAQVLNRQKIPCPREYKRQMGSQYQSGFDRAEEARWSPLSVRRILHNRMYTGAMQQGKDRKISYKLNVRRKLPEKEWICVEDRVPVLIPKWVFKRVGLLEEQRIRCRKGKVFCNLWSGIGNHLTEQVEWGEEYLFSYLCRYYLKEKEPVEEWMRRLFLVLFFQKIEVCPKRKSILIKTVWRKC